MHNSQLSWSQESAHYDLNATEEEDAAIRHGLFVILELRRFLLSQKKKEKSAANNLMFKFSWWDTNLVLLSVTAIHLKM